MAYCTQCGTPLPDTGRFCTQCGTPFANDAATSAIDDQKTQLIQAEPSESQPTRVIQQESIEDQRTQLIASDHADQLAVPKMETSGIDQFVMDIPQQVVVYSQPESMNGSGYAQPAQPPQRVYTQSAAPFIPAPPQKESRWPIVVIVVSVIVIMAAAAFAGWWFLLR